MYNYVRPYKVMNALIWLKANNPLYAKISINNDWVNESLANERRRDGALAYASK